MASIIDKLYEAGEQAMSKIFDDEKEKDKGKGKSSGKSNKAPRRSFGYNVPLAMEPMSEDEWGTVSQRNTLGLREQREGYQDLAHRIANMRDVAEASKDPVDLTNLLLAIDMYNKTDFARRYKKPKSKQERLDQIVGLEGMLNKLAGGLTGAEIGMAKAQFQPFRSGSINIGAPKGSGRGGKPLSVNQQRELADLKSQAGNMDALYKRWKSLQPEPVDNWIEGVWQKTKATFDVTSKEHEIDRISGLFGQAVAKAFEGGRLSDADRKFYLDQIPKVRDPDHIVKAKVDNLKNLMKIVYDQRLETFAEGGHDMSGFKPFINKPLPPMRDEPAPSKKKGAPKGKTAPKKKKRKRRPPPMSLEEFAAKQAAEGK